MLTQDDVTLLVALITFVYWQIATRSNGNGRSGESRAWYDRNRQRVAGGFVPGIAFPIIWFTLYALIVASMYIFFHDYQSTIYYTAILVLFICNMMLNKWWSVLFFDNEDTMTSLFVAVALFGTALAMVILLGMTPAYTSMGLLMPYLVWLAFAVYLNYQWNKRGLPTVTDGKRKRPLNEEQQAVQQQARQPLLPTSVPSQKGVAHHIPRFDFKGT